MKKTKYPISSRKLNPYNHDINLQRALEQYRLALKTGSLKPASLELYGAYCATTLDAQAEHSDKHENPRLEARLDNPVSPTARFNEVCVNASYHNCQQEIYKRGFVDDCFDKDLKPVSQMPAFIAQYMTSYSDISTGCPLAMTHPIALMLASEKTPEGLRKKYLMQMLRTDGKTPIGGTWATEKHSGSDVPATTTSATLNDNGSYSLYGHQWFASATGFERWITVKTAKVEENGKEGLGLFLVPKYLDTDWNKDSLEHLNPVQITALKDKMGTKGLATAEITLDGTIAYQIADGQNGLRRMMEALGCSRIHNAMAAAGVMHRSYVEAACWAENRETFGKPIIERDGIREDLLTLKTEWLGGFALAFEAAKSFDTALLEPSKDNIAWSRTATALAKYLTAEQALHSTASAMEIIGGLGYTTEHPIERIQRDAMVLRVWEGPKQIQANELISLLARGGADAFSGRLSAIEQTLDQADMKDETNVVKRLQKDIAKNLRTLKKAPEYAGVAGHRLLSQMGKALTYALLCEEAAQEISLYNDNQKRLVADYYADIHFGDPMKRGIAPSKLQRHFDDVVRNKPLLAHKFPRCSLKL